ncbi:TRAP transporter substrate-binding protein DctP [Ostreiculturibacter nitratireducens]|uniref:TRAP transporter substrate-binding protein DctP n=1 Tax=Ostreiculturibacter nitratireducens TaxID=3075226 RepID=UPI0031B6043C
MTKLHHTFALAAALGLGVAASADARDLRVAPGAPPAHPASSHLYGGLVEYLPEESDGGMNAILLGPEVVSLGQMKDALQTGLVDVGNLLPLYFPAELPNFALAGELSLSGTDPHAMGAALTEYTVNCASCQEEMSKFGIVYLGSGSSDPYVLLTTKPVASADDVKGLRLRSGGAPFSRWAEHFGAVPVSIGVGETFEAMSQGTIDGSMASIGDLLSFRLVELVKQVTAVPLGTYFSTSNFATAKNTWAELSAEERGALLRAANRANANFTNRWGYEFPAVAAQAAKDAGIAIVDADPAFAEAAREFAIADRETAAAISAERFGMTDAADRVAEFIGLVEKWEAISAEVNHDPSAMAERVYDEVWSKVDLSTYGM